MWTHKKSKVPWQETHFDGDAVKKTPYGVFSRQIIIIEATIIYSGDLHFLTPQRIVPRIPPPLCYFWLWAGINNYGVRSSKRWLYWCPKQQLLISFRLTSFYFAHAQNFISTQGNSGNMSPEAKKTHSINAPIIIHFKTKWQKQDNDSSSPDVRLSWPKIQPQIKQNTFNKEVKSTLMRRHLY